MRQIHSGLRYCDYPNSVHFSNVPALVRVYWTQGGGTVFIPETVTIQLSDPDGRTYTEYRNVYNLEVVFDVRRFMQTAFAELNLDVVDYNGGMWTRNYNFRTISAVVTYTDNNNATVVVASFSVDSVFGNIERGESTGGNIRRRWFVNYPFTLDFYCRRGGMFDLVVDGAQRPGVNFPQEQILSTNTASGYSRALLNVKELIDPFTIEHAFRLSQPFGYVSKNDVETEGILTYNVEVDRTPANAEKRVYLRWIDNQGRFCYWLFKDLGTSDAVAASSFVSADIINPVIYNGGMNRGTEVRQSFSRTKTRTLGAKSVDRETFDFLLTLASSPFVDIFDGYDDNDIPQWHAVNVSAATISKSTKPRQDFTIAVVEPSQLTQSL